eukprot:364651-Chlamydomonas_euryale.AAC.8
MGGQPLRSLQEAETGREEGTLLSSFFVFDAVGRSERLQSLNGSVGMRYCEDLEYVNIYLWGFGAFESEILMSLRAGKLVEIECKPKPRAVLCQSEVDGEWKPPNLCSQLVGSQLCTTKHCEKIHVIGWTVTAAPN